MFVGQAVEQYELFTGQPAPVDVMRQAVLDSLAGH
jgi:shikimate 5-dehydrogenase